MRKYETLMVLHPELPEAQTRETIDRAKRLIEGMGGQVHQMQEWGMRELAYSIRKLTRGYYVLAEYTAQPKVVQELERTLKIADELLRYITVAAPTARAKAQPSKPVAESPAASTPAISDVTTQP